MTGRRERRSPSARRTGPQTRRSSAQRPVNPPSPQNCHQRFSRSDSVVEHGEDVSVALVHYIRRLLPLRFGGLNRLWLLSAAQASR